MIVPFGRPAADIDCSDHAGAIGQPSAPLQSRHSGQLAPPAAKSTATAPRALPRAPRRRQSSYSFHWPQETPPSTLDPHWVHYHADTELNSRPHLTLADCVYLRGLHRQAGRGLTQQLACYRRSSSSATWSSSTCRPARCSRPPMFIRQPASVETTQSAPLARMHCILSSTMLPEICG